MSDFPNFPIEINNTTVYFNEISLYRSQTSHGATVRYVMRETRCDKAEAEKVVTEIEQILFPDKQAQNLSVSQGRAESRAAQNAESNMASKQAPQENNPTCPTCGSTNVAKISSLKRTTHGFMFGLFSNTARSQFECKNCGYKW